jgi:hypothetical protein
MEGRSAVQERCARVGEVCPHSNVGVPLIESHPPGSPSQVLVKAPGWRLGWRGRFHRASNSRLFHGPFRAIESITAQEPAVSANLDHVPRLIIVMKGLIFLPCADVGSSAGGPSNVSTPTMQNHPFRCVTAPGQSSRGRSPLVSGVWAWVGAPHSGFQPQTPETVYRSS